MPNPLRVLLVDDHPDDTHLVRTFLQASRSASYQVENVDSLAAMVKAASSGDYDVVLLDMTLPESQGEDTIRKAAAALEGTPIIVLTGTLTEGQGPKTIRLGADDFLVKDDISPEKLERSIRYAVERTSSDKG